MMSGCTPFIHKRIETLCGYGAIVGFPPTEPFSDGVGKVSLGAMETYCQGDGLRISYGPTAVIPRLARERQPWG